MHRGAASRHACQHCDTRRPQRGNGRRYIVHFEHRQPQRAAHRRAQPLPAPRIRRGAGENHAGCSAGLSRSHYRTHISWILHIDGHHHQRGRRGEKLSSAPRAPLDERRNSRRRPNRRNRIHHRCRHLDDGDVRGGGTFEQRARVAGADHRRRRQSCRWQRPRGIASPTRCQPSSRASVASPIAT